MNKYLSLLVLVALVACVFAAEKQDQESAEQYFRTYGYYPSWYSGFYGTGAYGVRAAGYPYYASAYNYPAAAYAGYTPASTVKTLGAYPYYNNYGYAYNGFY